MILKCGIKDDVWQTFSTVLVCDCGYIFTQCYLLLCFKFVVVISALYFNYRMPIIVVYCCRVVYTINVYSYFYKKNNKSKDSLLTKRQSYSTYSAGGRLKACPHWQLCCHFGNKFGQQFVAVFGNNLLPVWTGL